MRLSEEYIHQLITGKLAGTLSEEEDICLEQLISEDEAVKREFERIKSLFNSHDIATNFSRVESWDWAEGEDLLARSQHVRRNNRRVLVYASAAVLSCLCVGIYFLNNKDKAPAPMARLATNKDAIELKLSSGDVINLSQATDSNINIGSTQLLNRNKTLSLTADANTATHSNSVSMNSLTVPIGKDYRIVLSDGSKVWLNAATKLQFPFSFSGNTREISVNGEAFIEVAQNAAKPFIVHIPGGAVRVLGTTFNVNSYDSSQVRVALVDGAVNFKTPTGETPIKPGMEALYTRNDNAPTLHKFDENEVLGWRMGKYYFTEATFDDIVKVLPRWFGVKVVIENAAMREQRFSGMVNRNKPITVFLQKMKKIMNVDYYFDEEGVLHFK
ncbi:DUF4974 domain-containing protein [Chitinophaga agrisoli]|uniref:DUF4974 domain-containing protein n=1 Tax=Chitinophaga agrisoli TaxID=2607653 RepID=A0A5B2VLE4_9BACT|nr:FecR domain-containing protein [Chitinophaga agrisoli]KAA2239891.1 DUF4974 domain-containing protein [Chitinophaga agrisoli]